MANTGTKIVTALNLATSETSAEEVASALREAYNYSPEDYLIFVKGIRQAIELVKPKAGEQ